MSKDKKGLFNNNLFVQGFTGKRFEDGQEKRKKPMTAAEAAEKRRLRNAKYDEDGNLR